MPLPDTNAPRLFVDATLAEGTSLAGSPGQAHYLGTVMRLGAGAPVRVFNGRDGEYADTIAAVRRDRLSLDVGAQTRTQTSEPDIWLVFSPLKRDATDLGVQKAVELAAAVLPVFCARTNSTRINEARLAAIAIEAAEQCERLTIPALLPPRPLPDLLGDWPRNRVLAAALERVPDLPSPRDVAAGALLVGPEGGFTAGELDVMRATPFIQAVSLGPRILRAETAALAGLALLLSRTW